MAGRWMAGRLRPVVAAVCVVAVLVGLGATAVVVTWARPLSAADAAVGARLGAASDAWDAAVGDATAMEAAVATHAGACTSGVPDADTSLAGLRTAVQVASRDVAPAVGLLSGRVLVGDRTSWTVSGAGALVARLESDASAIRDAMAAVSDACVRAAEDADRSAATQAWNAAAAAAAQPIADAKSVLTASAGQVADENTRTALAAAIDTASAAAAFSPAGATAQATTAATATLGDALASLSSAVATVQASRDAFTQAQAEASASASAQPTSAPPQVTSPPRTTTKPPATTAPKPTSTSKTTTQPPPPPRTTTAPPPAPTTAPPSPPPAKRAACYSVIGISMVKPDSFTLGVKVSDPDRQGWTITASSTAVPRAHKDSGTGNLNEWFTLDTKNSDTGYTISGLPVC